MKLVIFDFNKTLYDPVSDQLKTGAKELLMSLQNDKYTLALLSTDNRGRQQKFASLSIANYFSDAVFVKQKQKSHIQALMKKHQVSAQETQIIGDNSNEELTYGASLGVSCIAVAGGLCSAEAAKELGIEYCVNFKEVYDAIA